jgi:pimeloyl-ACP methyl ester carboxylesterase
VPIAGKLVTETLGYDGGRRVTVYVPPDPPQAVVFAGDGQLISGWGGALETAGVPATMIVGVHRLADETLRLHEYSPGFDPERFAAHEAFFVGTVRRWAGSRFGIALPASRTAVFGVSASGELALAVGLRHPEVYGAVFCASPGAGYRPPDVIPSPVPRTYLVAGTQEPFFHQNATRWAEALRDAGADVVLTERAGSHGGAFWRQEFPLMVAWAFGGCADESRSPPRLPRHCLRLNGAVQITRLLREFCGVGWGHGSGLDHCVLLHPRSGVQQHTMDPLHLLRAWLAPGHVQ